MSRLSQQRPFDVYDSSIGGSPGCSAASNSMAVSFHGVRGSTPCHGSEIMGYGGNTSCVSLAIPGADPILFDLGTGLRYFGETLANGAPFRGHCLLSHLHWDHIQGLPFFTPLLTAGSVVDVYAPAQESGRPTSEVFADTIKPPLFPVELAVLPGDMRFTEVADDDFVIDGGSAGEIHVRSRVIPHVGPTLGFRVEWKGKSVAYLSDHQMPCDGSMVATQGALDLCRDADLLIHDSQYTVDEFEGKCDWGHCTADFAIWLAAEAGVERLALFHHDPSHDDEQIDEIVAAAAVAGEQRGVTVFAAREGQTVAVGL